MKKLKKILFKFFRRCECGGKIEPQSLDFFKVNNKLHCVKCGQSF